MGVYDKVGESHKLWLTIAGAQDRFSDEAVTQPDGTRVGPARIMLYADQAIVSGKLGIGCLRKGEEVYNTPSTLYVKGAVQIDGSLLVNGDIKKHSGGFRIDHPLDPEHKYLNHSFVESPDMKNIYDGVVTLDDKGEADVQLPPWFETFNGDIRYQLTAIGAPAPKLHVAKEMRNNCFKIAGGAPGMNVSWQVTGIRQDKFV